MRFDVRAVAVGIGVLLTCLVLVFLVRPPQVAAVDEAVFDQYQRWNPRPYDARSPVRVVDIDEASLRRFGQWPWPRTYIAEIVRRLHDAGAAAIVLDIGFPEPDRTSPAELARTLPRFGYDYGQLFVPEGTGAMPDHDAVLAAMIAQSRVVLASLATNAPPDDRLPAAPVGVAVSGAGGSITGLVEQFAGTIPNIPTLSDQAAGIGVTVVGRQDGGPVRRLPMFVAIGEGERPYPALALESIRVAAGAGSHRVKTSAGSGKTDFRGEMSITSASVAGIEVPLDHRGRLRIWYAGGPEQRTLPAHHLLEGDDIPSGLQQSVEGAIVFVGSSAAGVFDTYATPLSMPLPGVHIHAEVVEQILAQTFLRTPDWSSGLALAFATLLGAAVIIALAAGHPVLGSIVAAAGVTGAAAGSWIAFAGDALLISPFGPVVTILVTYMAVSGMRYVTVETRRREITRQFEHFVAPDVIRDIEADAERLLTPGGTDQTLTILFLDVRNFSAITEKMPPSEVIWFLNTLLTDLTDIILEHEGTIDKYIGDSVMAFWNAPRETPDHEYRAVCAMIEFRSAIPGLNEKFAARGMPYVDIGVGLNTGICAVGNMGSARRLAYSCVGDPVNLASRLEGQTRYYRVSNIIGSSTARAVESRCALIELDTVAVKGRTQPETIYTVAGDEAVRASDAFVAVKAEFDAARGAYLARDWSGADVLYRRLANRSRVGIFEPAPFCTMMLERIQLFRETGPPDDWNGVVVRDQK